MSRCPVMYEDGEVARNMIAWAISPGSANRPSGVRRSMPSARSLPWATRVSVNGVRTYPGPTALTRIPLYSVTYFLPSIIAQASETAMATWLIGSLAAIPWLFGAIGALLITPRVTMTPNRTKRAVTVGLVAMTVGTVVGVVGGPVMGMVGFALAGLFWFVVQPIMFSVPGNRLGGLTLATGLALMNTIGITGGFFGPTVMGFAETSTGNPLAGLWFAVALLLLAVVASFFLQFDPTRKQARR